MKLRPYQSDCLDGIRSQWRGYNSAIAVLATGLGKTVIAAHVIKERASLGRTMFLAHREELIWQAVDKIHRVTGDHPAVEMADYRADAQPMYRANCVVSTVQTQYSGEGGEGRMTTFDPMEFSTLIVDEAHHYTAASFAKVVAHYRKNLNLKLLGITATPDRADGMAMGKIFESVAFEFGILDGINQGWLVPIDQRLVTVDGLDLSNVHTVGGDLSPIELASTMEEEGNLHGIASPTMELVGERKTLIFAASVRHAEMLAEILNRWQPDCARWVCGKTPKDIRRKMFEDYAAGRFQVLVNVGVATEGFDDPSIEVIVCARPTKSRSLYTQIIGRGTRPLPGLVDLYDDADDRRCAIAESGKPAVEVIDFVGNSGRHKLVSVADILGGNYDDEVVSRAKKRMAESGKSAEMIEELKASAAELYAEKEREKAIEAARKAKLRVKAEYSQQTVDPFDIFQVKPQHETGWNMTSPPTAKQVEFLEKYAPKNVDLDAISGGEAGKLISEIKRRWDANECSVKQSTILQRYGLDPHATRDQAKEWIDKIAANGWKKPPDLNGGMESLF